MQEMTANVERLAPVPLTPNQSTQTDPEREASKFSDRIQPSAADLRLVIDEDPNSGAFVYKTVDRTTGQVVHQWPREEILRLREDPRYMAGDLIKTRV
jgi:flagellar protein FlaG